MATKHNFRFNEDFIAEYYMKKNQIKKLEEELKEMTNYIKDTLQYEHMEYSRVGDYTIFLEACHKPTDHFIKLMRKNGYESFIKETCMIKDFYKVCDEMRINNQDEYLALWYKKLYVRKGKK